MTKPVIVTRASKGSALTWTEGDSNFTNLQNATLTFTDGTNSHVFSLNDTVTFTAGTNITLSVNASTGAVTINNSMSAFNPASPGAIGGTTPAAITGTTITANTGFSGPHNGTVGATTPNTGAFTTLTTTGAVNLTGAASVNISPSGTLQNVTIQPSGIVKIYPTGSGGSNGIDNLPIGANAPSTGKFTNLTTTGYYNEAVYTSGSTTGTITPDCANGTTQKITLTGSITFSAFANPVAGQSMTLIVTQPASGGPYTLTSTMKFAGASKTLSTAANAVDILTVFYDGSTYWASLSKGFA